MRGAIGRRIAIGAALARRAARARGSSSRELLEAAATRRRRARSQRAASARSPRCARGSTRIPFLDTDRPALPQPRHACRCRPRKAVMFCLMDVSGSMDEAQQGPRQALLHPAVPVPDAPLRAASTSSSSATTPQAQEVDEENFFHSRETGGTVVSSALELMDEIIRERYSPSDWNIYGAQASRRRQLAPRLGALPRAADRQASCRWCRYFAYVQVADGRAEPVGGIRAAAGRAARTSRCARSPRPPQIYPVFRDLFKKKERAERERASTARELAAANAGPPQPPARARLATGPSS